MVGGDGIAPKGELSMPLTGKALEDARTFEGLWRVEGDTVRVSVEDGSLVAKREDDGAAVAVGLVLSAGRRLDD